MFKIGDFARLGGVSVRALRHYDEIGLLAPAAVDPDSGYRFYAASQLEVLNRIVALKELGFSLPQIGQIVAGVTASEIRGMYRLRKAQLEEDLAAHQANLAEIERRLRTIEREGLVPDYEITVKPLPAARFAAVRVNAPGFGVPNLEDPFRMGQDQLDAALEAAEVDAEGPAFLCYDRGPGDVIRMYTSVIVSQHVASVPEPAALYDLAPVEHAMSVVRTLADTTPYNDIYAELAQWAEANGYLPVGDGRDILLAATDSEGDPVTMETQWPCRLIDGPAPDVTPTRVTGE
ncbi:MAG: MerR family transcriptional regulator [Acidimicrobiales bacterium]